MSEKTNVITVDGIIAMRDRKPYLRLFASGQQVAQLSMAEARNVADDIVQMCARTEADAMIVKFFDKQDYPPGAAAALLLAFRDFRLQLDNEPVETSFHDPETGADVTPRP